MSKSRRFVKLLAYLRPHWRPTAIGIVALLVVNGLGAYIPLLIRDCVDKLSENFDYGQIIRYSIIIISLSSSMWLMRMASRIWIFGVGRQVEFDLKQQIFEHLLKLEPSYFATNKAGDLISRATSDVDNIRRLLGFVVLSFANTIFAYALTLPIMFSLNLELAGLALIPYPIMFFMVLLFSERLRNQQTSVQENLSDISNLIQEDISGISLIKIYAQEDNERRAFARQNHQLLKANLKLAQTRNTLFPLIGGLANISTLIIIWVGASKIGSGLEVGDFVALLLYIERLIFPTALLGFTITAYQRGEVSVDRVESIFSVEPKIKDYSNSIQLSPEQIKGELTAKNLTFTYPGAETPALDNVNFNITPGETIAIVGAIGSGKSTLANCLPRLLDIEEGELFLDGTDITQIALTTYGLASLTFPKTAFFLVLQFKIISVMAIL